MTTTNKSAIATAIFNESKKMDPVPPRKAILTRFINEAGLTEKGAATYYHNLRNKAGLVNHRAK